jgi:hypothetical protein
LRPSVYGTGDSRLSGWKNPVLAEEDAEKADAAEKDSLGG